MGAAVGHIPNNLCCVFTAKFLIHEEPHVHPQREPKSQLLNVPFLQTLLQCVLTYIRAGACMPHVCVRACSCVCLVRVRLCVPVCSFLVSGCEICGFSQSVLIFVSLSLSQQIIVKYIHTQKERERQSSHLTIP